MLDAMDRRVLPPCAQGARAVRRRQRFSGELTRRQANGIPSSRAFSHGPLFLDNDAIGPRLGRQTRRRSLGDDRRHIRASRPVRCALPLIVERWI